MDRMAEGDQRAVVVAVEGLGTTVGAIMSCWKGWKRVRVRGGGNNIQIGKMAERGMGAVAVGRMAVVGWQRVRVW